MSDLDLPQLPLRESPGRVRIWIWVAAVLVMATQWMIVTRGNGRSLPRFMSSYTLLSDALLHGELHLRDPAPAALLQLKDPFDPQANVAFRNAGLHDLVLYRGQIFVYFGPAPALVALILRALHVRSDDAAIVIVLALAFTVVVTLLMGELVRRRWIGGVAAVVGLLVASLSLPATWQIARPTTYEAAIFAGQFGLAAALFCRLRAERSPRRLRWLLAARVFAAFAVTSRISLVPAVVAAVAFDAVRNGMLQPRHWKAAWRPTVALALPLAIAAAGLLVYNKCRFGDIRESGLRWQLSSLRGRRALDSQPFSARYILPNLYNYALAPLGTKKDYALGRGFPVPKASIFAVDRVGGLWWACGGWWLALPGLWVIRRRWLGAAALGFMILAALPWLTFFYCAERYLMDVGLTMATLAALGAQAGMRRWSTAILTLMVVACGLIAGISLGLIGYR